MTDFSEKQRHFIDTRKKWGVLDDIAVGLSNFAPASYTFLEGELYNPKTHDLIPKKSYIEEQIKFKEKQLEDLKRQRENEKIAYENREKALRLEIDQLKQRL
jgi:hypothetical protein